MSNYSDPAYEIDDSLDVIRWSDVKERIPKLLPFEVVREDQCEDSGVSFAEKWQAEEYLASQETADGTEREILTDEDEEQELDALRELESDFAPFGENAFAVSEDFMEDFAREEAESIDGISANTSALVYDFIDWKGVAESLKQDMTPVMFRGTAYWIRG